MSTSPDTTTRADDQIVTALSRWLARHSSTDELRRELERVGTAELAPDQAEAVEELLVDLDAGRARAELEVPVREALEALALGG